LSAITASVCPGSVQNSSPQSLQLWRCAAELTVHKVCPSTIGNGVKNSKYPSSHPGITEVCPSAIAGSAPTKSGKNDDEGNQVEDGGNNREDHLNLQKGERKFDLDKVPDLEKIEEGPDESDNEAGDNDEEKPMIVAETKIISLSSNTNSWGSTGHTYYPKCQLNKLDDARDCLEISDV